MSGKSILISLLIVLFALIAFVIVGGFVFMKIYVPHLLGMAGFEMPKALETPAAYVGADKLVKSILLTDPDLGKITDIMVYDNQDRTQISVAGTHGASIIDPNGTPVSTVSFSITAQHIDMIALESDGAFEYMNRGSWGSDAALLDSTGRSLWTYGGTPGVDDMAAGDLDADGTIDFTVGFNGGGGVHRLSSTGKEIWRQSAGNVWHVEIADTDGDGKPEILHSNAAGQLTVRDASGRILRQTSTPCYFSQFSITTWPDRNGKPRILACENETIYLINFDGTAAATLDAPHCGMFGSPWAVPIRLEPGQSDYFAVLVDFPTWQRSVLYIFAPSNDLIYAEVLPSPAAAIAVLPAEESRPETLLIGTTGQLWQYTPKKLPSATP